MYGDERLAVMLSESVLQSTKGVGYYCYFFQNPTERRIKQLLAKTLTSTLFHWMFSHFFFKPIKYIQPSILSGSSEVDSLYGYHFLATIYIIYV